MFEGFTGALGNVFSGGVENSLKNVGGLIGTGVKAATGTMTDDDKAKAQGILAGTANAVAGTDPSHAATQAITGKSMVDYSTPNEKNPTAVQPAQPALAGKVQPAGTTPTAGTLETPKEATTTEKLQKTFKALQGITAPKPTQAPSIPSSGGRGGGINLKAFQSTMGAANVKSLYASPISRIGK